MGLSLYTHHGAGNTKVDGSKCAKKTCKVHRSTKFIIAHGVERNNQFEKQSLLSSGGVKVTQIL